MDKSIGEGRTEMINGIPIRIYTYHEVVDACEFFLEELNNAVAKRASDGGFEFPFLLPKNVVIHLFKKAFKGIKLGD